MRYLFNLEISEIWKYFMKLKLKYFFFHILNPTTPLCDQQLEGQQSIEDCLCSLSVCVEWGHLICDVFTHYCESTPKSDSKSTLMQQLNLKFIANHHFDYDMNLATVHVKFWIVTSRPFKISCRVLSSKMWKIRTHQNLYNDWKWQKWWELVNIFGINL